MTKRNNLVELARFLFSILVVGYHIQMTFLGDDINFFENGALAVEFFFLISGYFLARSIEKISARKIITLRLKVAVLWVIRLKESYPLI